MSLVVIKCRGFQTGAFLSSDNFFFFLQVRIVGNLCDGDQKGHGSGNGDQGSGLPLWTLRAWQSLRRENRLQRAHAQWTRRVSVAFLSAFNKENFTWELIYHLKPDSQAWSKKAKSDWESPYPPWKGRELQQQVTTSKGEGIASHPAPDNLTCWSSVTLLGLLPWAWKERMTLWLLGPLSVSVTIDYNDDFCMFCFFILVWLFFLFFSLIHRKTVSLSLSLFNSLFAKEDTKEEPKEI